MLCERISPVSSLLFSLFATFSAQSVNSDKPSLVLVKSGEHVTLNCTFLDSSRSDYIVWYKQRFGEIPQEVEKMQVKNSPQLNSLGVILQKINNGISLTIRHAKKEDEGLYFCGLANWEKVKFFSGTLLAVTGSEDVKVSVRQRGVSDSVPAGASVTLQCSVLSESRAAELQVLWFRAAPPQSHPQIIYTHHNSSHQCESGSSTHTCVYNFSKNILSLNDTGTYYCAVLLCGKIFIGNGTRIQMDSRDGVLIFLTVALAVCVVGIFVQAVFSCKRRSSRRQQGSFRENIPDQIDDAVELNYAALHFNRRKMKRKRRKKDPPEDCVYSEVLKPSAL